MQKNLGVVGVRALIAVALLLAASLVGKPSIAFAVESSGGCEAGGGMCCSCEVTGVGRDYVVSQCEETESAGFSECQDGTDESTPRGTCSGTCTPM